MKITLQACGREMTFSEEELRAFVEEHFERSANEQAKIKAVQGPTEGKWFEVNPLIINQELFQEERADSRQEQTRKLILEAFTEMKNNPEKYGKSFKTLMPVKWYGFIEAVAKIIDFASKLGDHNADWVEQGLEWAQRIHNGESWEAVCNKPDTAMWRRMVIWKEDRIVAIGDSFTSENRRPASEVSVYGWQYYNLVESVVPLVVSYK